MKNDTFSPLHIPFVAVFFLISLAVYSLNSQVAEIKFSGQLDSVDIDTGGAVYSGVPLGTDFFVLSMM